MLKDKNSKRPTSLPENELAPPEKIKTKNEDGSIHEHSLEGEQEPEIQKDFERFRATKFLVVNGDIFKKQG